jgi:carotenoid cleavage dioxygenase-like enzyme
MLGISSTGKHGRKFFDQLVHVKWTEKGAFDVYHAPARHYLGSEPIFINNPWGTGAVICHLVDAENNSSSFALFDAMRVARGPIALLRLKKPIHLGFHASFAVQSHTKN